MKRSLDGAAKQAAGCGAGGIANTGRFRPVAVTEAVAAAGQSSGSAEQPAKQTGTEVHAVRTASPTHTAEQLAQERAAHVPHLHRLGSLQECSDWLKTLPEHVVSQSRPLQRVRSVTVLLQIPASRQQRQDVQSRLEEWDVPQKHKSQKRNFTDVKTDFVSKVVEETDRLKAMHDAAGTPTPAGPASATWTKYSAIQAALTSPPQVSAVQP